MILVKPIGFTGARDSEWQWHQLGDMQICTLPRQITTPAPHDSVFLQAGCPSCRPTNSIKALKQLASPLRKLACHVGSHSVTCYATPANAV